MAQNENVGHTKLNGDLAQNTVFVWNRYRKLTADRRLIADRVKVSISDMVTKGYAPSDLRLAARIDAMSAGSREAWARSIATAAKLFGVTAELKLGAPTKEAEPELWGFTQQARHFRSERLDVTAALKELSEIARENGVDLESIKQVHRMQLKSERTAGDDTEQTPADVFDNIDIVGRMVGLWK